MHGAPRARRPTARPRRPEPRRARGLLVLLLAGLPLLAGLWPGAAPAPLQAQELRRSMPHIRNLLMGGTGVALADEPMGFFYNPATLAGLQDGSLELLLPQIVVDDNVRLAIDDPDTFAERYEGLTVEEFGDLIGTSLYSQANIRSPFLFSAEGDIAMGVGADALFNFRVVEDFFGLPALSVEYYSDIVFQLGFATTVGEDLWLGVGPKVISRSGLVKTIDLFTLFALGPELDPESDPDFKQAVEGKRYLAGGLDLGAVYNLPFARHWKPRIGLAAVSLGSAGGGEYGGMEFGPISESTEEPIAGTLPLIASAGFAVSPTFNNIRYTATVEAVDVGKTALPNRYYNKRTRLGFEVGIGPHEDGTALFSLLFGWRASHFSYGVLSRVSIFEVGFGRYTVERGMNPGDDPDDRTVLSLGMRF